MGHPSVTEDTVGMEWVMPGLPRIQWVRNGSCLGYHGYSGYGMGHAWVTEDTVGTELVRPGLRRIQ